MNEKIKHQIKEVLKGEANLEEAAHLQNLNIEQIRESINKSLETKVIFNGDPVGDLVMCAYWYGRASQFIASMVHLIGKEEFEKLYNQTCIELGVQTKKFN